MQILTVLLTEIFNAILGSAFFEILQSFLTTFNAGA